MAQMFWQAATKFPKYAIALLVILVSTGLFGLWWMTRPKANQNVVTRENLRDPAKVAAIATRIEKLFLAGENLYDAETGELVFEKWLAGPEPSQLGFDPNSKKLLARYPNGFVYYSLNGSKEAELLAKPFAWFTNDLKRLAYIQDRDVWVTDVDWTALKFVNPRQVTSMGKFPPQYFSQNIRLASNNVLLLQHVNEVLRIDLNSGDVKPMPLPLGGIERRRSPDGILAVGKEKGNFYAYSG